MRWEKEAPKGKVKYAGIVETRRISKGTVPKGKVKVIGKEVEARDTRKEMRLKARGAKEKRKEAKEKDKQERKDGEAKEEDS